MTPTLIVQDGEQVTGNGTENLVGCRDSDFDQYGDVAAFDIYPEVGFPGLCQGSEQRH